ncbi:MAG: hypothetical protein ILO34_05315, partial [Kiritimatiellae bacterium]|nr:hypothetical protein [Kiritimatiellia bacterium]
MDAKILVPLAALALPLCASAAGGDVSWMKDSVGIGAHWTAQCVYDDGSEPASFEEMVNAFDVDLFAGQLADAGATHLIFTLAHEFQLLPCPNAALDAIEPGRTSKRDLVGEIIAKLKPLGIKFVAYYNHSCNNFDRPENAKWFNAVKAPFFGVEGGSMETFASNYCAIVADISKRYGEDIAAWWFDSAPSIDSTGTLNFTGTGKDESVFPFDRLVEAAKSGNPKAAVAINPGVADYHLYTDNVDYYCGESVNFSEPFMGERRPEIADTRWICADSMWWVLTKGFASGAFMPRLDAEGFAAYIRENKAAQRMTTFNILVDARGKFNPMALAAIKRAIALAKKPAGEIGCFGRLDTTKFNIGTYCLEPYARSESHVRDLAECGIDLVVCVPYDRPLLDLFSKYGLSAVVSGVVPGWWGGDGDNAGKLHEDHVLEAYAAAGRNFADHPAIAGIDIGDEPSARDFPHYAHVVDWTKKAFPMQFPYLNLYPNYASVAENTAEETVSQLGVPTYGEYISEYMEKVPLPYVCYDFYVYGCRDHER